jgi:hypothetical protein
MPIFFYLLHQLYDSITKHGLCEALTTHYSLITVPFDANVKSKSKKSKAIPVTDRGDL